MSRFSRVLAVVGCGAVVSGIVGCSKPEEATSPSPDANATASAPTTMSASPAPSGAPAGAANSGMQNAISNPNTPPDVKAKIQDYQNRR